MIQQLRLVELLVLGLNGCSPMLKYSPQVNMSSSDCDDDSTDETFFQIELQARKLTLLIAYIPVLRLLARSLSTMLDARDTTEKHRYPCHEPSKRWSTWYSGSALRRPHAPQTQSRTH